MQVLHIEPYVRSMWLLVITNGICLTLVDFKCTPMSILIMRANIFIKNNDET
jgi:hypothetical protein